MPRTRPILRHLLAAVALIGVCAEAVFARDRAEILQEQKQQALDAIKSKPLLGKHKIEDIFSIRLKGTDLVLQTFIEPQRYYQDQRAELEGYSFPAVVMCRELSRDIPEVEFEFTLDDWSDPLVHAQLHIQSRPNDLQIEKTWYTPLGEHGVFFSQANDRVSLRVTSREGVGPGTIIPLSEDDFLTLRKKHRGIVEQYLRPLFREVRQEAAFAPEENAAWQVLADDWPVDPSLKDPVTKILPKLDDGDFRVRSKAADSLYKLGRGAAVYILHMDRNYLTAEQRLRLDEVLARFKAVPDSQAGKLHDDPRFLLDCLYCDDATIRKLAWARLQKVMGKDLTFDVDAKIEERVRAVNALREDLFPVAKPKPPEKKSAAMPSTEHSK